MTSYSAENSKSPRLAVIDELGDKRIISNDSNHKFFITSPPPLKTPSSTATSFYQSENNRCSPPNVRPPEIVTVVLDYKAKFSDELNLKRGSVVEVLSKDAKVSGDEGWWTGKLKPEEDDQALSTEKVGIFPSNFVRSDLNATLIELENRQDLKATNNCLQNVIFDDLKFENLLGIGGFGRVHKAKWKNQDVAKDEKNVFMYFYDQKYRAAHIEPGSSLDEIRDCVEREARLFGLLSHKNIVQLLGVSLQAPNFCLILEYCAGESLNKILKHNTQKLSANILIDWAMQIARGMHYLHEQAPISLVHRDLKSSNAREAQYASRMSMCGTYAWMSPEVIKNSTYSKASDVWSYGVLLWELLTGEVPYKNIDAMAIAYGVGVNQLTLPVPSTCPEPFTKLMHVILKLLTQNIIWSSACCGHWLIKLHRAGAIAQVVIHSQ
uniref:mitogen-activated protein kinase kinase kinase n=1 Tax=Romanomermis culicivorax TaxID=13658 RepID=A0A915JQ40_ROMCU